MEETEQLTEIQQIEGAVEAILFAAGHPVEYSAVAAALSLTEKDARTIAGHLEERYASNPNGGIMMLLFDTSCQLCTREMYMPYIREALGIRRGGNLSNSALETLAVVAYNQPVTRAFVDTVRGVDSAYAVNSLIDKELISCCGRLDAPGRPMLFGTTEKFLRVFGLSNLSELPEAGSVEAAIRELTSSPEPEEGSEIPIDIPSDRGDDPHDASAAPEAVGAAEGTEDSGASAGETAGQA